MGKKYKSATEQINFKACIVLAKDAKRISKKLILRLVAACRKKTKVQGNKRK